MLERMRKVVLVIVVVSAMFASNAFAHSRPIYLGGGFTVAWNRHSLNVPVYRADTLCGVFTSGSSFLPNGFLTFEMPLGDAAYSLWIAPRLHLSDFGGLIITPATDQANARSPVDSSLIPVTRESHLDATLVSLGAVFFIKYPITEHLFVFGGASVGFLLRHEWAVSEVITNPAEARFFSTGTQSMPIASGTIPNSASLFATASGGASIDVPLSPKVVLAPELSFTVPISSIRSDYTWHVWSLAIGATIKFNIAPEPKMEIVQPRPSPAPPKSELAASVRISGVLRDSLGIEHEIPIPEIRVEEFLRREAYPMLNYIFFAEDSADIPLRYHLYSTPAEAQTFDSTAHAQLAQKSALEIYHDELNILGRRLVERPTTTITVTGTSSNTAKEAADTSLPRRRAESVKQYLVNIWKIDPNRIVTRAEGLPENPSSPDTKEGEEENRRVEITSTDPSFLDPFVVETIDRTMNPPIIRLRSNVSSRITLAENTLVLKQDDRVLASFRGPGPVEDWRPRPEDLPRTDSSLVATLHLTDSIGGTYETADSAPVN